MAESDRTWPDDMLVIGDVHSLSSDTTGHSEQDDDVRLFPGRRKSSDWCSGLGSQNLASVLNDPDIPRSQSDCLLTKDWGSSFVETPVDVEPVSVTRRQLDFMRAFLKAVKKRAMTLHRFSQMTQSSAVTRRPPLPHQSITKIPDIFLRKNFDLSDEATFESVLSFSQNCQSNDEVHVTGDTVRDAKQQLSDILDLVEDTLSGQIAVRFRDFFHIMNAMDILMDQVSRTIREVTAVRGKCEQLRNSLVKPCVQNILLNRVRDNARLYLSKLQLMQRMYQSSGDINCLLSQKNYIASLQLISACKQVMDVELSGVTCFRNLSSELCERVTLIEKFLDEDLNKLLTAEWLQPFDSASPANPVLVEEDALLDITGGMIRVRKFNFVDEFREEACAAVITVIKQTLIRALAGEDCDVSDRQESNLYNQMKVVDLKKWLSILEETFSNLKILMRRITAVNRVIITTLTAAAGRDDSQSRPATDSRCPDVSLSEEEFKKWSSATRESLVLLCDFAQSRCSNLIERRLIDSNDRLSFTDFSSFAKSIQSFCVACDFLCGQPCASLNDVLHKQAEKFVYRFHEERKKKLNSLLDIEQWKSMESVPKDFQLIVRQIVEGKINGQNNGWSNSSEREASVTLQEEKFLVVNSVVLLIASMSEYWRTASELPIISADMLIKLIDLLLHFNARTQKLVLQGDAKQVSGLKSVTSRALINSARALELVLHLIPMVKFHFQSILSDSQKKLVKQFSDVSAQYREHVDKIHDKIVGSSSEFIAAKLCKWEAKPPVPSPHFVALIQHLSLLDANLQDSLPPNQLVMLFSRIHAAFKDSLREQLLRLNIVNDGGPQHGLVTQELIFYAQSMGKKSVGKYMKFSADDLWQRTA